MWLNLLLDSRNGFGAVCSESAFARSADSDCSDFLHVGKTEDPSISFAGVKRSQKNDVWNDFDYVEFSGLCSSNALRRIKKGEMPKNANA